MPVVHLSGKAQVASMDTLERPPGKLRKPLSEIEKVNNA